MLLMVMSVAANCKYMDKHLKTFKNGWTMRLRPFFWFNLVTSYRFYYCNAKYISFFCTAWTLLTNINALRWKLPFFEIRNIVSLRRMVPKKSLSVAVFYVKPMLKFMWKMLNSSSQQSSSVVSCLKVLCHQNSVLSHDHCNNFNE